MSAPPPTGRQGGVHASLKLENKTETNHNKWKRWLSAHCYNMKLTILCKWLVLVFAMLVVLIEAKLSKLKWSANVLFSEISQGELCTCRVHRCANWFGWSRRTRWCHTFILSVIIPLQEKRGQGGRKLLIHDDVLLLRGIFAPFWLCAVCLWKCAGVFVCVFGACVIWSPCVSEYENKNKLL